MGLKRPAKSFLAAGHEHLLFMLRSLSVSLKDFMPFLFLILTFVSPTRDSEVAAIVYRLVCPAPIDQSAGQISIFMPQYCHLNPAHHVFSQLSTGDNIGHIIARPYHHTISRLQ